MVLRFFILAFAFLMSCTGIERDSVCDEKSVNYNGCVGGVLPSSSGTAPSSSSEPTQSIVYGDSVIYEGETYKTVVIGNQTWMARNLNYAASGSKCGNGSSLSDENTATCDTYGRLYDWATAMALPASCNLNSCASQINAKHRGICPSGWHIPSDVDWDELIAFVGSSETAGRYLKAADGWSNGGNGQDKYGFSALPGGYGKSGGSFYYAGNYGYWWSASEHRVSSAYDRYMSYDNEVTGYNNGDKSYLFSVRCLRTLTIDGN
jgi:uncharacterized protein (TIGR02145 family)